MVPSAPTRGQGMPTNPSALANELETYLRRLGGPPDAPYIHPNPVSWIDGRQRHGWVGSIPDARSRDTISEFYQRPKQRKSCWLGLFSTPTDTWVGRTARERGPDGEEIQAWDKDPWHCWAAAVVANADTGKSLVIWDCDPCETEGRRVSQILKGLQLKLFKWIREGRCRSVRLWYNTDASFGGQDRCMESALRKIESWAALGDRVCPGAAEAGNLLEGCVQLKLL